MKATPPVSGARDACPIRATYRLQFHEGFRLADAEALVPYLHELGISHLYASPLAKAEPHSTHGYDVCDHQQLNPELGTEAELEKLVAGLHEKGMGLVLDIVPNHMGIGAHNPWWWDVLKHGRSSAFAEYFDIDWETPDSRTRGKVLQPVLEADCVEVVKAGRIKLQSEAQSVSLRYGGHRFPLAPGSTPGNGEVEKANENPEAMAQLLQQQHYRLEFWKNADRALNYRRFFGIASLAGLRVEEEKVFDDSHKLIGKWVKSGWLDGLRVDHPDGLREPGGYLRRLRDLAPKVWIVVEKILEPDEPLPGNWPVAGTTGYDFLNQANALFIKQESGPALTTFYSEFTGERTDYTGLVHDKKRAILDDLFPAEINRLLAILARIAEQDERWQDFTGEELRDALSELAACLPVYRIYEREKAGPGEELRRSYLEQAAAGARLHRPHLPPKLLEMLKALALGLTPGGLENDFAARFQQLTGPAMAKGVEDTAFYCFNRFVSLNEVGGDPGQFGLPVEAFHRFCIEQQKAWPHTMLASTTHDTKRGEDVRARLNVIPDIPDEWMAAVRRWAAMNERHRRNHLPDRNAEYLFYQTLAGAWPLSVERTLAYMEKAAREAKQHTIWSEPNEVYERALHDFIAATMNDTEFMADVEKFVASIVAAGYVNSLSQTLIKLTAPGVPDFYQGCELWNFSLVDPDNRQPVDFEIRRRLLAEAKGLSAAEAWKRRGEGMAKLWLIWKILNLRADRPDLFAASAMYEPLYTRGTNSVHVVAFKRGENMITVTQRLPLTLVEGSADTQIDLPKGDWRNVLTGETFSKTIPKAPPARFFPVALLVRKETVG